MLAELHAVLDTTEFEEFGWIELVCAEWRNDTCTILVNVHTGVGEEPAQVWEVKATTLRLSHIEREPAYDVELASEHPVLMPMKYPHVTLSFKGTPDHPREVLGHLWERHQKVVGSWISFDAYLNTELPLSELLGSGSGVLATGPKPLLQSYAEVLLEHGISISFINERPPMDWTGEAWTPVHSELQALVIGGTYLVGSDFQVQHCSSRSA